MRSYRANHNIFSVSANADETAINVEQTMNVSMMVDLGDILKIDSRRENNSDEATGYEEPDQIYDLGAMTSGSVNFNKMQPQHAAFIMAYGLGAISTSALGDGYKHTITPIAGDLDASRSIPSFTAMQRLGNAIKKTRFISMFVDSFTLTAAKDSWVSLSAELKGTGKHVDNFTTEVVAAAISATTLTLAANAVQGSTAAARVDSIHRIRCEMVSGQWTDVVYTAVSSATPAAITIVAPGVAATVVNYEILYIPTEAAAFTAPAKVQETPLRVSEMTAVVGGTWTGSAFVGGRTVSSEINSMAWNFANNLEVEFVPGAGGDYAARAFRPGRTQTVTIDKQMKDAINQQLMLDNEEFGIRLLLEGALYDATYKYQVEIIFPQCSILSAAPGVDGKVLNESAEIQVMEHATYGSVIVNVQNMQAAYMA